MTVFGLPLRSLSIWRKLSDLHIEAAMAVFEAQRGSQEKMEGRSIADGTIQKTL